MTKLLLLLAASSLTLASCGKPADQNENKTGAIAGDTASAPAMAPAPAPSAAVPGAQDYVAEAAAADQFEIQSSELVLKSSKNIAVRAFAQQMVSDHTASSAKLMTVVKNAALTAPGTGLHAKQQDNLAALRDAGTKMDGLYIAQQRAAHAEAIALHEAAASNTALPAPLAAFAGDVLPTVQAHARMLAEMKPARG